MQDSVCLSGRHAHSDAVIVLRRERIAHVGLSAGTSGPEVVRTRVRPAKPTPLLEVRNGTRVVADRVNRGRSARARASGRRDDHLRGRVALTARADVDRNDRAVSDDWRDLRARARRVGDRD